MRGCIQAKSDVRIAVEAILSRATVENPMTADQIIKESGHRAETVRAHISNSIGRGLAHNLRAGLHGNGLYAAGRANPKPVSSNFPAPRTSPPAGLLKLKPMVPPRGEASMRAFDIPSFVDGVQVPRNPPKSICGRVMPVGWGVYL